MGAGAGTDVELVEEEREYTGTRLTGLPLLVETRLDRPDFNGTVARDPAEFGGRERSGDTVLAHIEVRRTKSLDRVTLSAGDHRVNPHRHSPLRRGEIGRRVGAKGHWHE